MEGSAVGSWVGGIDRVLAGRLVNLSCIALFREAEP